MKKYIPKLLFIFFLLQPFLDIVAGISTILNLPNIIGIIIRFSFLIFCGYYSFFLTEKHKKETRIYLILLFIYLCTFITYTIITKDTSVLLYELQNTMNAFYFPITFVAIYQMVDDYNIKVKAKHLAILFSIYVFFVLFPTITNLGLESYAISKTGSTGWFNSANSISSILSLLLPFILIYFKNNKTNPIIIIIAALIIFYVFFTIGTKVPILCSVIILGLNILYYLIYLFKTKKLKQIIGIICILFISCIIAITYIPKTSFYKNIEIHMNYLEIDSPLEVFSDPYLLDHFIFSQRLTFLIETHENYVDTNITSKLIGIGYIENYGTDDVNTKTVEMDYYDIFYRHGIIGCILFFLPLLFYLKNKHEKIKNSFTKLNIVTSLIIIFILAFFSGHIFVAPATSIIVILILILYDKSNLMETT